jgi:hypothetical protein
LLRAGWQPRQGEAGTGNQGGFLDELTAGEVILHG